MEGLSPYSGRVALVHDFLLDVRGAERVFIALCELFPDADVFTAVYDEAGTEGRFSHRRVHTSFLQALHPTARTFRGLLPLYPYAMEALDLRGYDLVVSSSSAWAHGVIPDENALHVCYCHNPFRYAWNAREATLQARGPAGRAALGVILQRWRHWDWIAAQRVDAYIANSETTQRRIARYFTRDSALLHPPVETSRFAPGVAGEEYMVLSELMAHKRVDVAIRAMNALGRPLVVVGDGPDMRRLQRLAGPTVRFEGRVSDARAAELLERCRALVVTATEEFGIAAVEAQAAGRPVIALNDGGVRETVINGVTGTFFDRSEPAALMATVTGFDTAAIDPAACRANAERFDVAGFQRGFAALVTEATASDRPASLSARRRAGRVRARGLAAQGQSRGH